ncbi:HEAT repeat domain-containing protein [Nocardioides pacificus]
MGRTEDYRCELAAIDPSAWPGYLTEHSALPGPRANLELAAAVAELGDRALFDGLLDTDDEYLTFCGVRGLGSLAAASPEDLLPRLHRHARDQRWRVREAVAMALQRLGDDDLPRLIEVVLAWADDPDPLVQRAAATGICEPRLLDTAQAAAAAVEVCRRITCSLAERPELTRREHDVRTLRKALGFCWSVAVAADPAPGLEAFAQLEEDDDPDVTWIVRENLRKKRLLRLR